MGVGLSCKRCGAADDSSPAASGASEVQQINDHIKTNGTIAADVLEEENSQSPTQPSIALDGLFLDVDSDDEECDGLRPGNKVKIIDMKSGVDLNGQLGILQSFDASKQRWILWLEAESRQISVKAENLILHEHAAEPQELGTQSSDTGGFEVGQCVQIFGMKKAVQLNGQNGILSSFDAEKGRWIVFLQNQSNQVAVQPGHLLSQADTEGCETRKVKVTNPKEIGKEENDAGDFSIGDSVQISNMVKASHLNGEVGCLQSFDVCTGRWTLMLGKDSTSIAAKPGNLEKHKPAESKPDARSEKAALHKDNGRQEAYEKIGKNLDDAGCKQQ